MKYSLFSLLMLSFTAFAGGEKFNSKECLHANYKTNIHHEGKLFGLIKNDLNILKTNCIMTISFKNIFETKWIIDVCREPIHIKVNSKGSEAVYKRDKDCTKRDQTSSYCEYREELNENLQDYGLIFAQGERESLKDAHGQVYCTYLLVKKYLDEEVLFSKYEDPKNIFDEKEASCAIIPNLKSEAKLEQGSQEENVNQKQEELPASDEVDQF